MDILFIGAGKMATAIASGIMKNKKLSEKMGVKAIDPSFEAGEAFKKASGFDCFSEATTVLLSEADVIIIAVKPQVAERAALGIADKVSGKLIVSIAAGLKLATLEKWFNSKRIIRLMPNTPLLVGSGASAYSCADGVSDADENLIVDIFNSMGILHRITEDLMDTVTALSGSGPAYIFEMVQAMCDGAVSLGLPEEIALGLTVQTVAGAAEMLKLGAGTPDELRNAVTSPGGTTEAGLAVLEENNFRNLIAEVIKAAHSRSIELGKK